MRGDERVQDGIFSYVSLEWGVAQDHPLREIRKLTDEVFRSMTGEFDALSSDMGRRSIAHEYVLRALLLQVLFSVRSERQLVEEIDYNPLFGRFVRPGDGRCDAEPCGILSETRQAAGLGDGTALLRRGQPRCEAIALIQA
jgi:hypothetical protein